METKRKVLLVDDEQAILKILSIKLKVSGYEVITALNGVDALRLADSAKPDIMLLDIVMPGVDGFQVLEQLRAHSKLTVIVFSARPDNAPKALRLGANDFLAKPFDVNELVRRIERVLDGKR